MVQILPPKTSLGTQLGQAIGSGLSQGLQNENQNIAVARQQQRLYEQNRGNLQKALSTAGEIAKNPNTSPIDRTLAYLNAFAAIPGSEKYINTVLPMLNNMAAFQEGEQGIPSQQFGSAQPSMLPSTSTSNIQTSNQPTKMIAGQPVPEPTESPFGEEDIDLYEPFLGKGVKKYSPLEISAREQRDLARGMPNSPVADFMRKQNAEIEEAINNISTKQANFANYYNAIHPNMSPDDQRIAQKFYRSKDALQAPTNEEKSRIVDNFLDRYRSLRTNIANQTPRSLVDKTRSEQEHELRNQVDWLLKEGQRDLAKEYLTDSLAFGDAESERIIQKPTSQQEKILTDFPKLPELKVQVPTYGKYARQFQTYSDERSKKLGEYEKRLEQAIKPGTAKTPGLSLIVARDMAMDSTGMTWPEFNTLINKLITDKKITLDPYQTQELPKLTSPPHAGFMDMLIERR